MPLPSASTAAAALCLLAIGPSAGAFATATRTGASVVAGLVRPPPLLHRRPAETSTKQQQACIGQASRCRVRNVGLRVCHMVPDENDGNDFSDSGPSERPGRRKYIKKRASQRHAGGSDDGSRQKRRRGRPTSSRQNDGGGDPNRRRDRKNGDASSWDRKPRYNKRDRNRNSNASSWPRYKSDLDSALEVTDAEAFEASIDSFLDGEYSQPFEDDAAAPHPGLAPSETLDCALRSLRRMNEPYECHGAAVFMRFCVPLANSERWGLSNDLGPWKAILRGALSPNMLARQLRASSSFASLLDWKRLDVSDGFAIPSNRLELGVGKTLAFVTAALYFECGEPSIIQFTLRKIGGAWMIDDAMVSKRDWFVSPENENNRDEDGDNTGIGGGKGMP